MSVTSEQPHREGRSALDFDRVLDLPAVLDELVIDGHLTQSQAENLLVSPRRRDQLHLHPLEMVADQRFHDAKDPID